MGAVHITAMRTFIARETSRSRVASARLLLLPNRLRLNRIIGPYVSDSLGHSYHQLHGRDDWRDVNTACDLWTYAFFAPLTPTTNRYVPTSATVRRMIGKGDVPGDITGRALAEANSVGFFHWKLQFPEVFRRGGFDAVLGNPPWEQVQPEETKFFAARAPEIAAAPGAKRKALIAKLSTTDPVLGQVWLDFVQQVERSGKTMRESGRFYLTARGEVESVFALCRTFSSLDFLTGKDRRHRPHRYCH